MLGHDHTLLCPLAMLCDSGLPWLGAIQIYQHFHHKQTLRHNQCLLAPPYSTILLLLLTKFYDRESE